MRSKGTTYRDRDSEGWGKGDGILDAVYDQFDAMFNIVWNSFNITITDKFSLFSFDLFVSLRMKYKLDLICLNI